VVSIDISNTPLLQHANTPANFFMEDKQKSKLQLIWGVLLLLAGIGVFYRIPQIMPEIKKIEQFAAYIYFIYFCFYLLAILLVVGGGKKVYTYLKKSNEENTEE
jgi:cobalamin biosynthesis protein CobD/CbiB